MAGVFRAVGVVAGAVASVAAFVPGGQAVAAIAGAVSVVAGGLSELVASPRSARAKGSVNDRVIGANNPMPYLMGRCYSGGVQVHDIGWGGEVDGVENPYRMMTTVHSCAGPVDALEAVQANFATVSFATSTPALAAATGYYEDHWYRDYQLGEQPEVAALDAQWSGVPSWGASYKLSGKAALAHSLLFDKDGEIFAGGQLPVIGAIWRGVRVYDPRLDSTYPGGSGSQRIDDETTWAYSQNPALHALAYAYGRFENGKLVFGGNLGSAAIDLANLVAWANVCDANGWTLGGEIYEPGSKWDNLKRIAIAGGAKPVLIGGVLRFDYQAPRISLATITRDDIAPGGLRDQLGSNWKSRHNTIIFRVRSEAHNWDYPQSDPVSVASFVTEDGEEKIDEVKYELVTDVDQGAELAIYELYERRALGAINLPLKPHLKAYVPGDALTLDAELSPTGVAMKVRMTRRQIDPISATIQATFVEEDDDKHVAAGVVSGVLPTAPPTASGEDIDRLVAANQIQAPLTSQLITNSYVTDLDPMDGLWSATDTSIDVEAHTRTYSDKATSIAAATITTEDDGTTPLAAETVYHLYYDDSSRSGSGVTIKATQVLADAVNSQEHPYRHNVARVVTDALGGGGSSGGGAIPPGVQEDDWYS